MFVPYILLFGIWAIARATAEARVWLTYLQSAGPALTARLKMDAAKPNAVLNKISVAKRSSAKAKITAAKRPGSKT
jgi:hypothetical protein